MRNNKGFSLVELIVVIAIMAILAAVAIPTFATFIGKAQQASDNSFLNDIEYALELATTKDGGLTADVKVTVDATGKVTIVEIGTTKVYDSTVTPTVDTYDLASVVDFNTALKTVKKAGHFTDTDNNGEWTFAE